MKKIMLITAILFCLIITGCGKTTKVETPPWSNLQIEQMEQMERGKINTVPFLVLRY